MKGNSCNVPIGALKMSDLKAANPISRTIEDVDMIASILRSFLKRERAIALQCSAWVQITAADSQSQNASEMKSNERLTFDSRKPVHRMTHAASRSRSLSVKE